jgi:DNA-binding MarR family transcriptional regulator
MLYRVADSADGRRRYVRLTQDGLAMMHNILGAIGGGKLIAGREIR